MSTRNCDICGASLRSDNEIGVCSRRAGCVAERARRTYAGNRELMLAQAHARYEARQAKPSPQCLVCGRRMNRNAEFGVCTRTKQCARIQSCLNHASRRARRSGLEFRLSAAEVLPMPEFCPILGVRFSGESAGVITDDAPTLDRIDNGAGYVPGNVQWVSYQANRMKSNADLATLRRFAEWALCHCDAQERMPYPPSNIN